MEGWTGHHGGVWLGRIPSCPDEHTRVVHHALMNTRVQAVVFNELICLNQTVAGSHNFLDHNLPASSVMRTFSGAAAASGR